MSLASFLLVGKKKAILDTELDALFHSQTTLDHPESIPDDRPIVPVKKKKKRRSDVHDDEPGSKRPKLSLAEGASSSISPSGKQKKSRVRIVPEPVSEPGPSETAKTGSSKKISSHKSRSENSDEDGDDPSNLTHETLQQDKPSKPASRNLKAKYAPPDETKERRDARTIFIGNLAPDVATNRPLQKQLHRHVLASLPAAKIESTRFRSVAFQTPTSKLPEASDDAKKNKQPRQHDRDRASSWRDAHAADEPKTDEKKFLTPSQKKKIAFINKGIHSDADSVHAYIVFAYPPPHAKPANLPPPPPVMDPFDAAQMAVEKCNGTMFLDRMLRVDAVIKRSTVESLSDNTLLSSATGDPKLTIFVGNLDFTSKEEDLRAFFEGIVSAERGPPDTEGSQDKDTPKCWVTRVRIIRDKDTQLGKGFAYVQFSDRTSVDEILAFELGELKFAKRKLRVQRCKSIPNATSAKNASPSKLAQTSNRVPVPPVPKGDPSLGEKLAKLTKEERKRVKATDSDRVARRMAKKKARLALAKQGVPPQSKERERVRKTTAKKPGAPPKKTNKGRVRSEKSIAKRNTKK
ncbi:hypothetical protein L210DRAFT_3161164 [Boletus edulis BED1]|uniref:Nucleolar protein 12 n=1 Tax=Boletus edulis BED1 TaxID=1328754 RepID=A0AAD4BZ14_BOLED|nr:hypothetical protein L210DRAFT_3161164 [Boletus edulis BED1]